MAKAKVFKKSGSPSRDIIAAATLNAIIARYSGVEGENTLVALAKEAQMGPEEFLAKISVSQADALIDELEKVDTNE